jgi:hypothetical protein
MDVRVNPETERELAALAAQTGRDPETLVADAVAGYEGAQSRGA